MAAKITAQLDVDAKGFTTGLKKAGSDINKFGDKMKKEFKPLGKDLKAVGKGVATAAAIGLAGVTAVVIQARSAAMESQKAIDTLDNTLRNRLGKTYKQLQPQLDAMAKRMQKTFGFSDEDALEGIAQLVTSGLSYTKAMKSMNTVADIAAKRQTTLTEAARIFGLAAQGNTRGLREFGIVSKTTGDRTKDAALAMKEFSKFRGEAMKQAERDPFRMTQEMFGELFEDIGGEMKPALDKMANRLTEAFSSEKFKASASKLGEVLNGAIDGIVTKIETTDWTKVFESMKAAAETATAAASWGAGIAKDAGKGLSVAGNAAAGFTNSANAWRDEFKAKAGAAVMGGLSSILGGIASTAKSTTAKASWGNKLAGYSTRASIAQGVFQSRLPGLAAARMTAGNSMAPENLLQKSGFAGRDAAINSQPLPASTAAEIAANRARAHAGDSVASAVAPAVNQAMADHKADLNRVLSQIAGQRVDVVLQQSAPTHAIMS